MSADTAAGPTTRALEAHSVLLALLCETASIEGYLEEFARIAAQCIGVGTHCSITLRTVGNTRRAASSDARTARCSEAALAAGSGPGLTALDEDRSVAELDIWTSDRWLTWREAALLEEFRSAVAVYATAGTSSSIVLTLYSEAADQFSPELMGKADLFAGQVARVMALCIRVAEQALTNEDLEAAIVSRSTIDQAIGAIIFQNRCTPQDAFAILRRASSNRNIKVRDVASDLLRGLSGPRPPSSHFQPRSTN